MILFLRKKLGIMILIICLLCSLNSTNCYADSMLDLYSTACVLIDADTGRILYGKDETIERSNASTTKILTCIIALEQSNLKDVVTFSEYATKQPKVHLGAGVSEQFYMEDLLYALMLESYNDSAVAIAEHIAGSVEQFSVLMNEKAKEIGCTNTHFITPNGLDETDENGSHHTSAYDLAKIMMYCTWESPMAKQFLEITQCKSRSISSLQNKSYVLSNGNALLGQVEGLLSGKTGFTSEAGYCYVASLEKEDKKFCVALLGCGWPGNKTYKWSDAKKLFSYGVENYQLEGIEEKLNRSISKLDFTCQDAHEKRYSMYDLNGDVSLSVKIENRKEAGKILISKDDNLSFKLHTKELKAPMSKETQIGVVDIYINNVKVDEYKILLRNSVYEWKFSEIFSIISQAFFIL